MILKDKKLLVVQVAGLGYELLRSRGMTGMNGLSFRPAETVFPALTCPVQASFRTASLPARHGLVGNGMYFPELARPFFWEQSARLVDGPRIWEALRRQGKKVAMLFWQQSLGEDADILLSPAPIHRHHGGLIQDCYSRPSGLYRELCAAVGGKFDLAHYWGPGASARSSDWIAAATAALLKGPGAPELCLTYLPVLDYDLQRFGPLSSAGAEALGALEAELDVLLSAAVSAGYEVVVFGDYAIGEVVQGAVFPNRALKHAGLLRTRSVAGMQYPDFHASDAFAIVDHEVAHVHVRVEQAIPAVLDVLRNVKGIELFLDRAAQVSAGIGHRRSGDLVLVAAEGCWFAYPWWDHKKEAPDYAGHVDIHNKPGYDPCELFRGVWPPFSVSRDCSLVRGSHGRTGPGRAVAWAATFELRNLPSTLIELAAALNG